MTKLKLSDWSNLAEIATSVVVVASLAYVSLQITPNTPAIPASTFQAFNDNLVDVDLAVVTNAHLDRIISLGEISPSELTSQEWSTFTRYSLARVGQLELGYLSHLDGTMSELHWSGIRPFMEAILCLPGYQKFWSENYQDVYAPAFIDYVQAKTLTQCIE